MFHNGITVGNVKTEVENEQTSSSEEGDAFICLIAWKKGTK